MIELTGSNFIATEPSSKGTHSYHAIHPKTGEAFSIPFIDATDTEIKHAVDQAVNAFQRIRKEDIPDFLDEISHQIIALDDQLIEVADSETALGQKRLLNERTRTCNQLQQFADFIREGSYVEAIIDQGDYTKTPPIPDIRRMLISIGPVVVFPASNFPFAFGVCGGDTASAWAAGCPVIVKAHPSHPQTAELFAHAVHQAIKTCRFPKGIFSLLHGKNIDVSEHLVLHPQIEAIGFTGSHPAGRAIHNLAATREKPIPVYAEMGSINPLFIFDTTKDTAQQLADSITLGEGQFCTKPGVIFLLNKDENLIADVIEKIKEKQISPLLNNAVTTGLNERVKQSKSITNVQVLLGGNKQATENMFDHTILVTNSHTFLTHHLLQQEHFGPVAIFVICQSQAEFTDIVTYLDGQLTASIYMNTSTRNNQEAFIQLLIQKVGRLIINGVPTGVRVCPAMNHGGPYPATTAVHTTSVGMMAVKRFLRPIAFQNTPDEILPIELKNKNTKKIMRRVNCQYTTSDL